jgi:MGT family glycosyltransferase
MAPGVERFYNEVRADFGLVPIDSVHGLVEGDLNLLCDVPEYAPVHEAPDHFQYVGPIVWNGDSPMPDWFDTLDPDCPTLYFTMGSTGPIEAFQMAMAAFADSGYQVMMTAGTRVALEALQPAPSGFRVASFAPGDALANRAHVVVCHAGNGTTYQALAAGVPLVTLPFVADQQWNARRQEELGVGLIVRQPSSAALREAVDRVMTDPHYREAASDFQERLVHYRGAQTAAAAIDRFLAR